MHFSSSFSQAVLLLSSLTAASALHQHSNIEKRNGAGSVVTNKAALGYYRASATTGTAGVNPPNQYTCYSGPASNFPLVKNWVTYDEMWTRASQYALTPFNDTGAEQADMKNSINKISLQSKVDQRVILAVILDESSGNVRVKCTQSFGGVKNCGLMQSYNGSSFNPNHPAKSINKMIVDGTQGTQYGPGLVQLLNDANGTPKMSGGNLWKALREYNSGSVDSSNLSNGEGATDAYVSNIANFLLGWNSYGNGPADCNFGTQSAAVNPAVVPQPVSSSATATSTITVTRTVTTSPTSTVTLA